jgi:hypothetical protein
MTWFEYMVSFIVGLLSLLFLLIILVLNDALAIIIGLWGLTTMLTFFTTYIYIRCNLKGVAKAIYGEHNIWYLGLDSFSVFHVKVFGYGLSEIMIQGSRKMQNRLIASRKFFKRDIPPDLIFSFNDNAEKLVELKKNYPWLIRLHYLVLIEGVILFALIPFL